MLLYLWIEYSSSQLTGMEESLMMKVRGSQNKSCPRKVTGQSYVHAVLLRRKTSLVTLAHCTRYATDPRGTTTVPSPSPISCVDDGSTIDIDS